MCSETIFVLINVICDEICTMALQAFTMSGQVLPSRGEKQNSVSIRPIENRLNNVGLGHVIWFRDDKMALNHIVYSGVRL